MIRGHAGGETGAWGRSRCRSEAPIAGERPGASAASDGGFRPPCWPVKKGDTLRPEPEGRLDGMSPRAPRSRPRLKASAPSSYGKDAFYDPHGLDFPVLSPRAGLFRKELPSVSHSCRRITRLMPHPSEQIIDVREDEAFDVDAVAAFLEDKLDGASGRPQVRQFGGGKANLTYLLDYGGLEFVLRRPPLGPVAESAHDMKREYTVLSHLHEVYPLAPQAFVYCDDPGIIGAEFFIMERRKGVVVRESMPEAFADHERAPQKMSQALIHALADLHAVDYDTVGLGDLGKPDGFIRRQIEGWYQRWQNAKPDDSPVFDAAYRWLQEHQPEAGDATLVHNDYKLDNLMLNARAPGTAVAVFDWDMCTLGDPLSDLGALLTYWIQPEDPAPFRQFATMPVDDRFPSRAELVAQYAEKSGRDVSQIRFYHALGLFRLTVIVAQIYLRYRRGQTEDQRFAALGPMIEVTAQATHDVATGQWDVYA